MTSLRRPPVLSDHQKQATTTVESGVGLCDEGRRQRGEKKVDHFSLFCGSVGPVDSLHGDTKTDAGDLCHVVVFTTVLVSCTLPCPLLIFKN